MSKHSRKKARRHKRPSRTVCITCPSCLSRAEAGAELLLTSLADSFNLLDNAGVRSRLRHGIVMTRVGYVLQIPEDGKWVARTLRFTEFPVTGDDPDYEEDD